jgi:hypothetical protein
MPALNFQKQFADRVAAGEKRQTIRAWRKRPFRTGDKLFLYTGMRHPKACRKLGEATASRVVPIVIGDGPGANQIYVDGGWLTAKECTALATADGFECVTDMLDWFRKTHGLPFYGQLIQWDHLAKDDC